MTADTLHYQVGTEIASQYAGYQTLTAPVLIADYTVEEVTTRLVTDRLTNEQKREELKTRKKKQLFFVPQNTRLKGVLRPQKLHRGIFTIPVYKLEMQVHGDFSKVRIPRVGQLVDGKPVVAVSSVTLLVPVKEPRGISAQPVLQLGGRTMDIRPSHEDPPLRNTPAGFTTSVDPNSFEGRSSVAFSMTLDLHGSHDLRFIPLGGEFSVDLQSIWPHPKFDGEYLPTSREVSRTGFKAQWFVTEFANSVGIGEKPLSWDRPAFGVQLIEPVDIYTQSDRAIKYGFLFILLTLEFFLLFEVLRGLRIHVAQYCFVGAALSLFYLLLVALAEHIGFAFAYLAATVACVSVLTVYVRSIVRINRIAVAFGCAISVLYGALYVILLSEQYALLLGAGLLFLILALTMFLTRNVDWYALEGNVDYMKMFRRRKSRAEVNEKWTEKHK